MSRRAEVSERALVGSSLTRILPHWRNSCEIRTAHHGSKQQYAVQSISRGGGEPSTTIVSNKYHTVLSPTFFLDACVYNQQQHDCSLSYQNAPLLTQNSVSLSGVTSGIITVIPLSSGVISTSHAKRELCNSNTGELRSG